MDDFRPVNLIELHDSKTVVHHPADDPFAGWCEPLGGPDAQMIDIDQWRELKLIEACITGERQLEIRLQLEWKDEGGIDTETMEVSYHGAFTVWWRGK